MNITRYSPFWDFENMLSQWRRPLEDSDLQLFNRGEWLPAVDISETDKDFQIKLEIPEVKKEDLHVEVANGMLTIKGERRQETKDEKRHRTERYYGRFERSFSLPDNVREDDISAEQTDGMLYIRLGKSDIGQAPRKLEINVS